MNKYQVLGTTTDRVNWIEGTEQKSDQAVPNQAAIALVKVNQWQESDRADIKARLEGSAQLGSQLIDHVTAALLNDGTIDDKERQQLLNDVLGHVDLPQVLSQAAQGIFSLIRGKK